MKKKYQLLSLLKKIKKNKLSSNLNTLNLEKRKLERISEDLKEMLEQSSFVEGEILNSSQLRQMSSFRENLQEKLQISSNREIHLEKEMNNYLSEISKIKKQKEKIEKKIKHKLSVNIFNLVTFFSDMNVYKYSILTCPFSLKTQALPINVDATSNIVTNSVCHVIAFLKR